MAQIQQTRYFVQTSFKKHHEDLHIAVVKHDLRCPYLTIISLILFRHPGIMLPPPPPIWGGGGAILTTSSIFVHHAHNTCTRIEVCAQRKWTWCYFCSDGCIFMKNYHHVITCDLSDLLVTHKHTQLISVSGVTHPSLQPAPPTSLARCVSFAVSAVTFKHGSVVVQCRLQGFSFLFCFGIFRRDFPRGVEESIESQDIGRFVRLVSSFRFAVLPP